MAGVVKHAERSHRSYAKKANNFRNFRVKAYAVLQQKEQHKTIGQRLASMLRRTAQKGA